MSAVPSQAKSRPTTPHQEQLNQTEGANRTGADRRSVAIIAALTTTNDGRDPPTEGGQNKRKRQPA